MAEDTQEEMLAVIISFGSGMASLMQDILQCQRV
jgi:hypothetical protein